jgi:hypothetical protein
MLLYMQLHGCPCPRAQRRRLSPRFYRLAQIVRSGLSKPMLEYRYLTVAWRCVVSMCIRKLMWDHTLS